MSIRCDLKQKQNKVNNIKNLFGHHVLKFSTNLKLITLKSAIYHLQNNLSKVIKFTQKKLKAYDYNSMKSNLNSRYHTLCHRDCISTKWISYNSYCILCIIKLVSLMNYGRTARLNNPIEKSDLENVNCCNN